MSKKTLSGIVVSDDYDPEKIDAYLIARGKEIDQKKLNRKLSGKED